MMGLPMNEPPSVLTFSMNAMTPPASPCGKELREVIGNVSANSWPGTALGVEGEHRLKGVICRIPDLPAICQQPSLTSPQTAPCRFDAIGVLTSADREQRVATY
jgi:hypothetical protein